MVKIEVEGLKKFDAQVGRRLVLAIEDAGIDILHRCGGQAKCTTCRVEVLAGDADERNPREQARLAREQDITEQTRLSCQIIVENPLRVRVLRRLSGSGLSDAGPRPAEDLPPIE